MFGKKNIKLDSKVRFQHTTFVRRLDEVKNYKRTTRAVPEDARQRALWKLGLGTIFAQAIAVCFIAALTYVTFIPNFLFVKDIIVFGAGGSEASDVQQTVQDYFSHNHFYWPQRNLLLLDENKLKNYILSHNQSVLEVRTLEKQWPHTLNVTVLMKREAYIVQTTSGVLTMFNDGTVATSINPDQNTWNTAAPAFIKIKIATADSPAIGKKYFDSNLAEVLQILHDTFEDKTKAVVAYIEPVIVASNKELVTSEAINPEELNIYVKKTWGGSAKPGENFRVLIDAHSDIPQMLSRLNLLLGQLGLDRYYALSYIDMRLKNRSFVCLVATPCVEQPQPPLPTTDHSNTAP